jgi:hypothetical protein
VETIAHLFDFLRPRPVDPAREAQEEARKNELIDKLARAVRARQLESPAVLFLELNRPIGFLLSQAAFFARPFLSFFLRPDEVEAAAEVLADPKAFDRLLECLGESSEEPT